MAPKSVELIDQASLRSSFPVAGAKFQSQMGVSEFWGSYHKDPTVKGTVSGSPIFGKPSNIELTSQCSHVVLLCGNAGLSG